MANGFQIGGTSFLLNLDTRLESELRDLIPTTSAKVHYLETRRFSTWIGASKFASLPEFDNFIDSSENYSENGDDIISIAPIWISAGENY